MATDHSERTGTTTETGDCGTAVVPWYRQTKSFARRSLRELARSRVALFWAILWPVFWYFLTMVVFISEPRGVPADQLAAVMADIRATNAISFGLFGAFTVTLVAFAQNFTDDLEAKRYRKLRSLPIAPSADLTGRFLAGFVLALASFWTVVGVGYLDGASFALADGWLSVVVVLVSLLLFCIVGMSTAVVFSTVVEKGEYLTIVTNTTLLILFFSTGYNGIQAAMSPMREYVNLVPNSLAARMQIYHLTDVRGQAAEQAGLVSPALPGDPRFLALLLGFAVVLWCVAVLTMRRSVYGGDAGE
ncbi:ABC transporter permease [Haloarchaeobius baliensis]|uniref:ABC transporter permease n=1 Tax=Haloarchaeobius baliensis TaxID=1670458 RepID=UPI003F882B88